MKDKIKVTRNTEFQRVQFKIPESINFKLKLYGEDIDATENSIVNELLEDFTEEIDFRTMLYNSAISCNYYNEKVLLVFPPEELGFSSEGNRTILEKSIMVESILTNLGKALFKYGQSHEPKTDEDNSETGESMPSLQYPVSYRYSFRGEQEIKIVEHDSDTGSIKIEKRYLSGIFNTFEEFLSYFKIELSSNCEVKRVALDKDWSEEDEQLEEKLEI
ncbi:MAG: hypothetical protein ACRCTS_09735 [Fusobacteriaceae bacterium]